MKISYQWLKEFIEIKETPDELEKLITKSGLEVEKLEKFETIKGGLEGIVIGKVLTCEQHPNADRLRKTTVDIGANTPLNIVCGAPNVAVGQTVLVATIGAELFPKDGEPFKISKNKIRGEVSEGMLCGADELGLPFHTEGIVVIEETLEPGALAKDYYKIESDSIFEIGLTPNRADAASHLGVARDIKAITKRNTKQLDLKNFRAGFTESGIKHKIENTTACPKFSGLTIRNVKIDASPEWLQNRLKSIGINPINNVVDATNYVLHSLGQPLHAYDLEEVKSNQVIVRMAQENEHFVALDGSDLKLTTQNLVVANSSEVMSLAGVIGGKNSSINNNTRHIFLESAYFNPEFVRKSSMQHGIKTDSSFRFERGTDPNIVVYALKRCAALIVEIAGGEVSSDIVDSRREPFEPTKVETSLKRIHQLIGVEIPSDTVLDILTALDIRLAFKNGDLLVLEVPQYRVDVKREADIIEEVLRIYGYDNIPLAKHLSTKFLASTPAKDKRVIQKQLYPIFIGKGFQEIQTNSLIKSEYVQNESNIEKVVPVLNKLSEDLAFMRPNLLYSGLETIAYNINRKQKDLKLFEFGKIYFKDKNKYKEQNYLSVFLTGNKRNESWAESGKPVDFFDLKTIIVEVLQKLNIQPAASKELSQVESFIKGVEYTDGIKTLMRFGYVANSFLKLADIKQPVLYAEINVDLLVKLYQPSLVYQEVSKFPEVRRDLSLVLDEQVTFKQIKDLAIKTDKKLIQEVNVFDVYTGDKIEQGKKSYSVSFTLLDKDQTLTDTTIDQTMKKLISNYEKELNALIRN
jgi:phenylalanyl-tRNA synthetase beta chain